MFLANPQHSRRRGLAPDNSGLRVRLTPEQVRTILATVAEQAGSDVRVVLYGSRVHDASRGGDVDLLIESATPPNLLLRARIKLALESALQLPVDIIAIRKGADPTPFQAIAIATGIALETPR